MDSAWRASYQHHIWPSLVGCQTLGHFKDHPLVFSHMAKSTNKVHHFSWRTNKRKMSAFDSTSKITIVNRIQWLHILKTKVMSLKSHPGTNQQGRGPNLIPTKHWCKPMLEHCTDLNAWYEYTISIVISKKPTWPIPKSQYQLDIDTW